jgi:beta-lactamase superfamily II metal-dependent hydrolase
LSYKNFVESVGYSIDLQNPVEYLTVNFPEKNIFRFISTHPHMDHLTGLSLIKNRINNVWLTHNNYSQDVNKLKGTQCDDWKLYQKFRNNIGNHVDGIKIISPKALDEREFYSEDGIIVLSPTDELIQLSNDSNKANKLSTVIVINYMGYKFVFGGDAENETWEYIYKNHGKLIANATILKASHHGRDSGYHMESVKLMNPEYTIVSVGKKPEQDASNKYRRFTRKKVVSTRWYGNITITVNSDGHGNIDSQYNSHNL